MRVIQAYYAEYIDKSFSQVHDELSQESWHKLTAETSSYWEFTMPDRASSAWNQGLGREGER